MVPKNQRPDRDRRTRRVKRCPPGWWFYDRSRIIYGAGASYKTEEEPNADYEMQKAREEAEKVWQEKLDEE